MCAGPGIALYRAEKFSEADEVLAGEKSNGGMIGGMVSFFRAMALFRHGDEAAARELFTVAKEKMQPIPEENKVQPEKTDHNQLIVWLAYREADALINK